MAGYDFSRYLNVRTATGPSFSPDGARLSFLSDVTGVPQIWSVPVESGWPDQLTFYVERISEAHVSPVADEVLFAMDAGGNERHALFLLQRNGAQITPLTNAPVSSSLPTASRAIRPSRTSSTAGCRRLLRHAGEGEAADLERGHAGSYVLAGESRLAADGLDVAQRVQVALRIARDLS